MTWPTYTVPPLRLAFVFPRSKRTAGRVSVQDRPSRCKPAIPALWVGQEGWPNIKSNACIAALTSEPNTEPKDTYAAPNTPSPRVRNRRLQRKVFKRRIHVIPSQDVLGPIDSRLAPEISSDRHSHPMGRPHRSVSPPCRPRKHADQPPSCSRRILGVTIFSGPQ